MDPNTTNEPTISDEEMKMPEGTIRPSEQTSHLGIILAALIVMLVLLLAGLYLWGASLKQAVIVSPITPDRPTRAENNEPESTNAEADVDTAAALSTSNELDLIQADLENTNLNTLDAELTTIDIEMENP